ncbi:MAG TPA: hypothetical protein VHG93_22170 [Longimicrobium sp.]|nr:hypothetical protein [Longimicrobium sp.]
MFSAGEVLRTVATASLNSISNDNVADDAGWAVDRVTAAWNSEEQRIKVTANLGVRDSDGYLLRMSFQVAVLARVDEA